MTIRNATLDDLAAIKRIAVDAQMFDAGEVDFFDEMLGGALDGSLADHHWLVSVDDDRVRGAAYCAPEPFADRVWNLHFLAVDPVAQGQGVGATLIDHVESGLVQRTEAEARVLIVETPSTDRYAATRHFYVSQGFDEEARIRAFYGAGDDKVVFWKSLLD